MLKLAMSVLWPSFMVAILAEGFFFSIFDPVDLMLIRGHIDYHRSQPTRLAFSFSGHFARWRAC